MPKFTTDTPITAFGMALKLKAEASFPDLVKIRIMRPGTGYPEMLDDFLEHSVFLDIKGETTTDPTKAVLVVYKKTGMYSHHTTYFPVANLVVDVQTYPSPAHRDHEATIDEEDDDNDHLGTGFDDAA